MSWDDFYPGRPHPQSLVGLLQEGWDRGALWMPDRIRVLPAFMRSDTPEFSEPPLVESDNPHLTIVGGAGGTAARLEDLSRAASALDSAGASMRTIRSQSAQLLSEISSARTHLHWKLQHSLAKVYTFPLLAAQIDVALGDVESYGRPVAEAADECVTSAATALSNIKDLARSMRRARQAYLDAEAEVERALESANRSRAMRSEMGNIRPFDPSVPGSSANELLKTGVRVGGSKALDGLGRIAGKNFGLEDRLASTMDETVDDAAYALLALTPFTLGVQKGGAVERLAGLTSKFADKAGKVPDRHVEVSRALGPERSLPMVHDVQGAARTVERLTGPGGAEPGTVALQRNVSGDGEVSWVAMLPGTQGGLTEEHGSDWLSNGQLMAGEVSASVEVIAQAMEQAGVQPGEEIMMIGHSQGGIAATAFAALPGVQGRYDIKHVVTLGSPVANQDLNPDTEYLSVENQRDIVPAADGMRNPDEANRTTVIADSAHLAGPTGELETGAHSMTGYRNVLDQIVASDHPSATRFVNGTRNYFDPKPSAGGSAQMLFYKGTVTEK